MCSCSPVQVNGDLRHRHQPSNGSYLVAQDRHKTGDTDGCAAMKDSLHMAERSVGLASQQSAQYSTVDGLRTASAGALFLRVRLLVDLYTTILFLRPGSLAEDHPLFLKLIILFICTKYWRVQFFAKNGLVAKIAKLNTR